MKQPIVITCLISYCFLANARYQTNTKKKGWSEATILKGRIYVKQSLIRGIIEKRAGAIFTWILRLL